MPDEFEKIITRIDNIRNLVDWAELHKDHYNFVEIRRELNVLAAQIKKFHELIVGEKA